MVHRDIFQNQFDEFEFFGCSFGKISVRHKVFHHNFVRPKDRLAEAHPTMLVLSVTEMNVQTYVNNLLQNKLVQVLSTINIQKSTADRSVPREEKLLEIHG